jgi:tRNA A37 threonylcarbamoyladenosine modification protein TsaB
VVTDARRRELYWATYGADGRRRSGPAVDRPADVLPEGPLVGDAVVGEQRLGVPVAAADVTTAGLVRAAAPQLADPSAAGPLLPLYLRRPDAVPPTAHKAVSQP